MTTTPMNEPMAFREVHQRYGFNEALDILTKLLDSLSKEVQR